MSVTLRPRDVQSELRKTRAIAAGIGAVVVFDVVWVRAPFLLMLGLPFIAAAWRYRNRHVTTSALLTLCCLLYLAVGISFALSNGLNAPAEPGDTTRAIINPGDFAAVYIGTPLAAWLGLRLAAGLFHRN